MSSYTNWRKKFIIVGDLDANIGQEEREIFQRPIERWSSHEVSNNSGLKATDFAVSIYFPARRYTRKYDDLQITSITDVGSFRGVKCDTGHYLVCMMK
jgi:hypothetical protein